MAKLYGKERDRNNPKQEKQIYEEKIQNEEKMKQEWKKNSMTKLYGKERDRNNGEIYKKKTQGETKMKHEWKEKITMKSMWKLNQTILILIFIVLSSTYAYGMEANNNRLLQLKNHIWDGYIIISLDYEDLIKLYNTCKKINELLREVLKIPLLCARSTRKLNYRLLHEKYYHLFRQIEYLNDTFETIYMHTNDDRTDAYLIFKPQDLHKIQSLTNIQGSSSIPGSIRKIDTLRFWYMNGNTQATIASPNDMQIVQNNKAAVVLLLPHKSLITDAVKSDGTIITFHLQGVLCVVKCNYGFMALRETYESDDFETKHNFKKYHFIYWTNDVYNINGNSKLNNRRIPIRSHKNIISIADGEKIQDIRIFETDQGFKIVLKNKILELDLQHNERKETISMKKKNEMCFECNII